MQREQGQVSSQRVLPSKGRGCSFHQSLGCAEKWEGGQIVLGRALPSVGPEEEPGLGVLSPQIRGSLGGLPAAGRLRVVPFGFDFSVLEVVSTPVLPLSCWRCRWVCRDCRLCPNFCSLLGGQMCVCADEHMLMWAWAPLRTGSGGATLAYIPPPQLHK